MLTLCPAGQAMLTAINVLMLRILENSNKNSAFGSLLQHLLQCPQRVRHRLLHRIAVHTCCSLTRSPRSQAASMLL